MKYPNGVDVRIGDKVRFERGGAIGTVASIIDANHHDWSVDEPGVMLLWTQTLRYGRCLLAIDLPRNSKLIR